MLTDFNGDLLDLSAISYISKIQSKYLSSIGEYRYFFTVVVSSKELIYGYKQDHTEVKELREQLINLLNSEQYLL